MKTYPYHVYVPSFGEWGFVLAAAREYALPEKLPERLKFLTLETLPELFRFPNDMRPMEVEPNRLNDQILVRLYEREWKDIVH